MSLSNPSQQACWEKLEMFGLRGKSTKLGWNAYDGHLFARGPGQNAAPRRRADDRGPSDCASLGIEIRGRRHYLPPGIEKRCLILKTVGARFENGRWFTSDRALALRLAQAA
jgi:hypothetical protein